MKSIILAFVLTLFISPCFAQRTSQKTCRDWQLRVAPTTSFFFKGSDDGRQEEIFEAVDCLLKLKGKKYNSNFGGATRADVSQTFGKTSVEVAALYFITYLVHQKWDYADAPFLVNKKQKLNTSKSVNQAYKAYKTWFAKVKEMGLEEARKQNLNPLVNTTIRWY
jgi:hypothetical protein